MANMTSLGQNGLKNGVYEFFTITDTTGIFQYNPEKPTIRRTLTVKNDTVLYEIRSDNGHSSTRGTFGDYFLKLEKHTDSLYKAKNEDTELHITVMSSNIIEIEEAIGHITLYYSGGVYLKHTLIISPEIQSEQIPRMLQQDLTLVLPPQKQTLTLVCELTTEDEKKLLNAKRNAEYEKWE
jgi:hypothetical protein